MVETRGCTEPYGVPYGEPAGPAAGGSRQRLEAWALRWQTLRETLDSEWSAAYEAFATPGTDAARKWLGWALYRLAARVNPEVHD